MALIVRIDVDRPYGRHPPHRHLFSRLASDLCFPKLEALGYLDELRWMLELLNGNNARAHVFFRRCTLPSAPVLGLIEQGGHEIGLHLENSHSYESFFAEKRILEHHVHKPILSLSKHGSGGARYGWHHHAPYEPERYVEWARHAGMRLFLGNLEDPTIGPINDPNGFVSFPAAFWLEPHWRDVKRFTVDWLVSHAQKRDTVLLVHPENILESPELTRSFARLVGTLKTKILP
jgi:hypothetical protein